MFFPANKRQKNGFAQEENECNYLNKGEEDEMVSANILIINFIFSKQCLLVCVQIMGHDLLIKGLHL